MNWYRTSETNYGDELSILGKDIKIPVLFIQALNDSALPPHLGKQMAKKLPYLTVKQVNAHHWLLWERPDEMNAIIAEWLKNVVFSDGKLAKL